MKPSQLDALVYVMALVVLATPHSREHAHHLGDITDAVIQKHHRQPRNLRLRGRNIYIIPEG